MEIVTLSSKTELLKYRKDIDALFYECFNQRSLGLLWDWAYLENPCGDPLVSLGFEDGVLVGHYAIIPMPIMCGTERKNSYLSLTSMVAESHRKSGLFATLGHSTYRIAAAERKVDFVMGFPNKQATPGRKKRLNWVIPCPDYVITVNGATFHQFLDQGHFNKRNKFTLDMNDPVILKWRLSRPGGIYHWENGVAYKEHQNAVDIIWWRDEEALATIPVDLSINILADCSSGLDAYRLFEYQFGGASICDSFNPSEICREMAISDLF